MEAAIYAQTTTELNLAEARLSSGVSLEHIAKSTRISMRFLEAIEAEQFDKLPGGVFALNYVRQYARCIGFDETTLVECCKRSVQPPPELEDLTPLIEAAGKPRRKRRGLLSLPIVRIRILWTSHVRRRGRSAEADASL